MGKSYNLILMSYWRTAIEWLVSYLQGKNVKNVVFIMNASKYQVIKDPNFIFNDKEALVKAGFTVEVIDLDTEKKLLEKLKQADVIYVRGGNTFDLLHSVRNSGFDKLLGGLLEKGKIYAGSSAGSILPGPNIEIAENDFMSDENNVGLEDKSGLGIVKFAIFPHYLSEYDEEMDKLLKKLNVD